MTNIDMTHFDTYAGLCRNDARGQWTTADLAQWCYSNSDDIADYNRIAPDDWAVRMDRTDGEHIDFRLEYSDAGDVDGWTATTYDAEGYEYSTDGGPLTRPGELKALATSFLDWAANAGY